MDGDRENYDEAVADLKLALVELRAALGRLWTALVGR